MESVHVAHAWQSLVALEAHSSMLAQLLKPSPAKPELQLQLKAPYVLVHAASAWHVCVPRAHSSSSVQ